MPEEDLEQVLLNLNYSLEFQSPAEMHRWTEEFNQRMRLQEMFPTPKSSGSPNTGSPALDFVAGVVKNKGLRLPFLEKALNCDKVVLSGSVDVKQNFLDVIRGQPLQIKLESPRIQLKINF